MPAQIPSILNFVDTLYKNLLVIVMCNGAAAAAKILFLICLRFTLGQKSLSVIGV